MKAPVLAVAVLTCLLPSISTAQVATADVNRAVTQLRGAALGISPLFFADVSNAEGAEAVHRLNEAVEWLGINAGRSDVSTITPEYLRSLERSAELLKQRRSIQAVRDVIEELEAKVAHCRALGVGMGGTIRLRVNTRRSTGPVGDWQVVYLLKIYETLSGATPINFPQLSTPTEATVEPGRYWIWARDPATGRTTERSLVRVVGQKELFVDLPVP